MDRVNGAYVSPDLFGAGKDGFRDGNKALGISATIVQAEFLNSVQEEIANVIEGAGLVLNVADRTQLKQAISLMLNGADAIARFTTTANINLNGLGTQAGGEWAAPLTANDIIFVKDQAAGAANGWYVAAAGAWTRVKWLDESAEVKAGMLTKVSEGVTQADTIFMLTTDAPIVLGTTALAFARKDGNQTPDATTTVKGKAQLATTAQVQALADLLTIVTPGTLASVLLGCGQTWQNVGASRANSTNYTNTTGKPIVVSVMCQVGSTDGYANGGITVDGAVRIQNTATSRGSVIQCGVTAIVPPGSVYQYGGTAFALWHELR
jgi:hypothetical protein